MNTIIKVQDFLNQSEIEWLMDETNNFETDYFQIYNTHTVYKNELIDFRKKITEYIKKNFKKYEYEIQYIWINQITDEDVSMDIFHVDTSDLTIVTYFRTDFEGGDFEYFNGDTRILIKPEINLSLIMDNKIQHRITKVTKGKRYSLVSFFGKVKKDKKTLI